jgi:uncharacterized protein
MVTHDYEIVDVPEANRFEVRDGDVVAAHVVYRRRPGLIAFIHTEVDDAYAGGGVGSLLIRAALDAARADGLEVLPFCPFVNGWIQRHADYLDLVPAGQRERFGL